MSKKRRRKKIIDVFDVNVIRRPRKKKRVFPKIKNFDFGIDVDDIVDPEDLFNFEKIKRRQKNAELELL
tara:strand:- start:21 stop:227 length:207 start_codon:yes stop_codon:yes gene_type:complete